MDSKPIYKTAEELGIEQWEHDGLVALIGPLSRDSLTLRMSTHTCGTSHCIAGWVDTFTKSMHPGFGSAVCSDGMTRACVGLHNLYFPNDKSRQGWRATAPQAARAIVNFLVTGDPQWDAVMAGG